MRVLFVLIIVFIVACNNSNVVYERQLRTGMLLVIDSLTELSNKHYVQSNNTIAEDKYIRESIELAKKNNLSRTLFKLYLNIAKRLRNNSDHAKAIEYLQLAQEIAHVLNSDSLKAAASHNIAVNFRRMNENGKALKFHTQALELAENVNDTFLIHCSYNGIGNVYFDYNYYEKAIVAFHNSLKYLGKQKPNILGKAINANLLGESWLFLGNKDSALFYLQQSFDANKQIGSEMGKGICYNGMGLVYLEFDDYKEAINEFKKAVHIFDSLGLKYYKSMALSGLGEALIEIDMLVEAENALKETFRLADEIGGKRFALEASSKLAKLYNKTGNLAKSYDYSQIALAYKDSVASELKKQNTEAMNILYRAEKQEREINELKHKAEISQIKLERHRYIIGGGIFIAVVTVVFILLAFRQKRLKGKINEIALEQKLLLAQLNPHFIFNSLSSVQNFILKNNRESASEYLVNFSRLMRNILMASGEDFITLENELEMLDDYLKLQRLRFRGKFNYAFSVDAELDAKTTRVPPMMVQPFVENSLEHGIRFVDYQGEINVNFRRSNNKLCIEVDDNGYGLGEQQETEKKKGHISMATKITRQRMKVLQAITGRNCSFKIIDKQSVDAGRGVLVKIIVPFLNK